MIDLTTRSEELSIFEEYDAKELVIVNRFIVDESWFIVSDILTDTLAGDDLNHIEGYFLSRTK